MGGESFTSGGPVRGRPGGGGTALREAARAARLRRAFLGVVAAHGVRHLGGNDVRHRIRWRLLLRPGAPCYSSTPA